MRERKARQEKKKWTKGRVQKEEEKGNVKYCWFDAILADVFIVLSGVKFGPQCDHYMQLW